MNMSVWDGETSGESWEKERAGGAVISKEREISLCSMRMGDETFGIDTEKVREVLGEMHGGSSRNTEASTEMRHGLRRVPLAPVYVAGVIPYRGEVLTTLSLRALLGGGQERPGGCVLVLDDEETGERLGLMVDAVSGVVTVGQEMLEGNPCTLNARSRALFDGVYKTTTTGLIVRIDPRCLNPARLAATGLFDSSELGEVSHACINRR